MLNYKEIWQEIKPTNDWINSTLQNIFLMREEREFNKKI